MIFSRSVGVPFEVCNGLVYVSWFELAVVVFSNQLLPSTGYLGAKVYKLCPIGTILFWQSETLLCF
jgi:hypothetical protein